MALSLNIANIVQPARTTSIFYGEVFCALLLSVTPQEVEEGAQACARSPYDVRGPSWAAGWAAYGAWQDPSPACESVYSRRESAPPGEEEGRSRREGHLLGQGSHFLPEGDIAGF